MNLVKRLSDPVEVRFSESYDSHYSLIFSIILSKVDNFHDAEDLCQEVFIRFYEKIEEVESPRKWLLGCLRNVIFDYYKKKRHVEVDIDQLFDDVRMGYVNGFRDARITISGAIREVCGEEDADDASLFDLITIYHYSFAQASAHLGISYKQARYRYNRMADRVKDRLRENGIEKIEDLL